MLKKIVHSTRECVGIIAGFQHTDGPLQVIYLGGPDPCDPCGVDAYVFIPSSVDSLPQCFSGCSSQQRSGTDCPVVYFVSCLA